MIDTKALREKVLDLAIRGKLVPQDPNDEPASVLLERIRAEKQQMVKDGKLKPKDIKNDTIIFKGEDNLHYEQFQDGTVKCIEDEIPFDVPDNWAWCRLTSLSKNITKGASPKWQGIDYTSTGTLFITSENIGNDILLLDSPKYLSDRINEIQPRSILKKHDILTNIVGASIGRTCEYTLNDVANTNQAVAIIRLINLNFVLYIVKCLNSSYCINLMADNKVDMARANLSLSNLSLFLIPLPPINEQNKITASLNILFGIIDEIENAKDKLIADIENIKSKILDLAIRGKLVPQDPSDEPASVLLARIREEKEELIKQGKIKRDKRESIIFKGEDNSYYQDIPNNWCLINFSAIATLFSGRDLKPDEYNLKNQGIPYITGASNFCNGEITINRWTENPQTISIRNDILLTCKGTVGEIAINYYDNVHIARQIMAIRVNSNIYLKYIKLFFLSIVTDIKKSADGLIPGISRSDILNLSIPIPPIAEQHKIVNYVENIFDIIEDII